jgi:hypothetical protein
VTAVFSGTLAVGVGSVNVSGAYLGSNNWALAATASLLSVTNSMTLTNAQLVACQLPTAPGAKKATLPTPELAAGVTRLGCPTPTGAATAVFSGTLTIGSGTISVSGSYLGSTNWALAAAASTLSLTSSMSLTNAQVVLCQLPTAQDATLAVLPQVALAAGVTRLGCPTPTGAVTAVFSGTLTIGSGSVNLRGSYLSSNNWAAAVAVSSLSLESSMSLTNAQVVVCQLPTTPGATLASLPTVALPTEVSALGCPTPTGAVTAVFSGTMSFAAATISVTGS